MSNFNSHMPPKRTGFLLSCVSLFVFCYFLKTAQAYTFHGCAMAPNSDQGWVVTSETTLILHTSDGGANLERQNIPTTRAFSDVFFLDSLSGWTLSGIVAMIWHTTNGGDSWFWQNLGLVKYSNKIFFFDSLFGLATAWSSSFLRTTNGGVSWTLVSIRWLPYDTVAFYGASFVDHLNGWLCAGHYPLEWGGDTIFKKGQGFIVHTEDGGDSWVLQKRDTIYDFFDIKFKDSLEGWVVGGNDSTMEACVYHTIDGGQSWNLQQLPQEAKYLWSLELIDGNKLWAVGRNGTIIHSSDGGNSWEIQISGVDTTLYDVDFADSLRGIIAGDGVILYTRNGGDTWYQAYIVGLKSSEENLGLSRTQITANPNPFSKKIEIRWYLPISKISIYNATGKLVTSLQPPVTSNCLIWNGTDDLGHKLPPGIYILRFNSDKFDLTKKLILEQ